MRIVIDIRSYQGTMHGIGRCGLELVKRLDKAPEGHRYLVLTSNVAEPELRGILPATSRVEVVPTGIAPYSLAEQFRLPRLIKSLDATLFHSTTYTTSLRLPCPYILTIFDLMYLTRPDTGGLARRLYMRTVVGPLARRALAVVTGSSHVAGQLQHRLHVRPERTVVAHPGHLDVEAMPDTNGRRGDIAPFFLAVLNARPHKGGNVLAEAMRLYRTDGGRNALEVVGTVSPAARRSLETTGGVTFHDRPDDAALAHKYTNALALISPSLDEGVGLPVVEALAVGTPSILTDIPAHREVAGPQGGIYVPPGDPRRLADALLAEERAPQQLASTAAQGRTRVQSRFGWDQFAESVLALHTTRR